MERYAKCKAEFKIQLIIVIPRHISPIILPQINFIIISLREDTI